MGGTVEFLAGVGLGAGLMYLLDPQMGRRRRALVRDQAFHLAREAEEAAEVVARDASNRFQGLAAGDLSVLAGGKRALSNPLMGHWSPTGRAFMGALGGSMVLYGLTQEAPVACVLGSMGLLLTAEAIANVGVEDVARLPQQVASMAGKAAENLGVNWQSDDSRQSMRQPAGAGI